MSHGWDPAVERGLKDGVALRLRHRVRWGRWVPRRMEDDALTSEDDGWCGLPVIDSRRAIGNSGGGVCRGLWGGQGDDEREGEVGVVGVEWEVGGVDCRSVGSPGPWTTGSGVSPTPSGPASGRTASSPPSVVVASCPPVIQGQTAEPGSGPGDGGPMSLIRGHVGSDNEC